MGKYIIEVREFDSEAICDLQGCLEAVIASEDIKVAKPSCWKQYYRYEDVQGH